MALAKQHFSGNPLNRSSQQLISKTSTDFVLYLQNQKLPPKIILVIGSGSSPKRCLCERPKTSTSSKVSIAYVTVADIVSALNSTQEQIFQHCSVVLLGTGYEGESYIMISLTDELASQSSAISEILSPDKEYSFENGRSLLEKACSFEQLALAGQSLALATWHDLNRFDGRSGQPTIPVEFGMKRKPINLDYKIYPRIDPVMVCTLTT